MGMVLETLAAAVTKGSINAVVSNSDSGVGSSFGITSGAQPTPTSTPDPTPTVIPTTNEGLLEERYSETINLVPFEVKRSTLEAQVNRQIVFELLGPGGKAAAATQKTEPYTFRGHGNVTRAVDF